MNAKSVYDAYLLQLPTGLQPSRKGKKFLLQTMTDAHQELVHPNSIPLSDKNADIRYHDLCKQWEVHYGCLGGAFLSLCRTDALARYGAKFPLMYDLLIRTAIRLGLNNCLQESTDSGISLYRTICWNLPGLALRLLNEPRGSNTYPNLRQIVQSSAMIFYHDVLYGPYGNDALLQTIWEHVGVVDCLLLPNLRFLLDSLAGCYGFEEYSAAKQFTEFCLSNLAADVRLLPFATTLIHRLRDATLRTVERKLIEELSEIVKSHSMYIIDAQSMFPLVFRSLGLLSCLHPLLQSYVF